MKLVPNAPASKTFAEQAGKAPFDWNAFLENPPEKDSREHRRAYELAGDWPTCACGNQCAIIPRTSAGSPEDLELHHLGMRFLEDIDYAEWGRAKETLFKIESRSAEILAELNREEKK